MVECEKIVKDWMKRYPREWGLVLCRKDLNQYESLVEFYGEDKVESVGARDLAYCWWFWVLRKVYKVPRSLLEKVDLYAHIDPYLTCSEQLHIFETLHPDLRRLIKKHEEEVRKRVKEIPPEEVEKLRFPSAEEAAKFCEEHPDICEAYPIVPEYIAEGQLTAEETEELIKAKPEVVEEIDSLTLEEAWEKYIGEKIKEIKRRWEEAQKLPERERRQVTLDLWLQLDEIERELRKRVQEEEKREVEEGERVVYLPSPEIPGYLKDYLLLTGLNCVAWTEREIAGRKYYIAEVIDEATEEKVKIIVPWLKTDYTEIVTITNKEGREVQVCAFKGEVEKLYLIPPPIERIAATAQVVSEEVKIAPPVPYEAEANVDWDLIGDLLTVLQRHIRKLKRVAEKREPTATKVLLQYIRDTAEDIKKELSKAPIITKISTDIKVQTRLTRGEIEDLWSRFCLKLAEHNITCDNYRDLFERYIQMDMNVAEAENAILTLAKDIIEEELAKRREKTLEEPKPRVIPKVKKRVRISWKQVNWAVAKMSFDLEQAKEEAEKKNATGVYRNVEEIERVADTVLALFKT